MTDYRVKTIVELVKTNLERRISLKELSSFSKINYSYLSKILKREIKSPYSKYMKKLRIQKAIYFLKKTEKPIKEIVILVGYKNISHFYKDFRFLVGCTPNKFKAKNSCFLSDIFTCRMATLINKRK